MKIPISQPLFGPEELRAVQEPLESGWVVQGPKVKAFEDQFAAFIDTRFAAATTSCTTALHLAMVALGVKPGDEVLVPAFTWVATPNVVEYMGATPIFCDIDLTTFNIDVKKVESLITPKTVGLLPVHLFGLCADMDPLIRLAQKHHLWIVEDAACAFGGQYRGRHAGTFGKMGCFSFHPRKSITTGEGGMVTTTEPELDLMVRSLRDHGATRSDLSRHQETGGFLLPEYPHVGYNYRMTDIQGALGCAQMARASSILERRAALARRYDQKLAAFPWLKSPSVPEGYVHGYQAYVCLFRPEEPTLRSVKSFNVARNALMADLEANEIATRPGTHAPVLLEYYREKYRLRPEHFPNAFIADQLSLALPLFPQLSEENLDRICGALEQAYLRFNKLQNQGHR